MYAVLLVYRLALPALIAAWSGAAPAADDTTRPADYFYQALPYGSQANFTPANVIINGGFGILQIPDYTPDDRRIFQFPYADWSRNVWETIRHPLRTIDQFGWNRFLASEILPVRFNDQWVPNYSLHMIAAGMLSRKTEEWFRYHRVPRPRLWSIATMVVYHALSEVVENPGYTPVTVDHLSDIYIFDPLGILLFTNDGVCRFFSRTMHLAEWSLQPACNLRTGNLENMGQFYIVKIPLDRCDRWHLPIHFGFDGMTGLSRRFGSGAALTVTAGFIVGNLVTQDTTEVHRNLVGDINWCAGIFYDRDNSLQASLVVSNAPLSRLVVNLYPGVLRIGPARPGLFLTRTDEWVLGLSVNLVSFGAAWGW